MGLEDIYFIVRAGKGNPIPQIVNWYGTLDVRKLKRREYMELPEYVLLDMRIGMDVVYPDILTEPVLMVSAGAKEVIQRYDKEMPFLFVALFGVKNSESVVYYCPILADEEDAAVRREVLYRVETRRGTEIRMRLDLVESLLCRGAVGMELMEIQKTEERGMERWGKII